MPNTRSDHDRAIRPPGRSSAAPLDNKMIDLILTWLSKRSKESKKNDSSQARTASSIEKSLQERDELWSRDWCPFCGQKNCKSKMHFLKLYTLPRNLLPPKYNFILVMLPLFFLLLLFIGGRILYLLLKGN